MADLAYALKRLQYAAGVMYRDNLVADSKKQAETEMAKGCSPEEQQQYEAALADLDAKIAAFKKEKAMEDYEGKLKRTLDDCKRNFPRFADRVEKSIEAGKKSLEEMGANEFLAGDEAAASFIATNLAALDEYAVKLAQLSVLKDWESLTKKVVSHLSYAKSNCPRFMDRVSDSVEKAEKAIADVEAEMDRFRDLSLDDGKSTTEVLDDFREQVADYRDQVAHAGLNDAIKKAINGPLQKINEALSTLDRQGLYQGVAKGKYDEAMERRAQVEDAPEWSGHPKWEEFVAEFDEKEAKFKAQYDEKEINDLLKKATGTPLQRMEQALYALKQQGLYQGVAAGKFEEALDFKIEVMGNEKLHGHDLFYAFVEKFEALERQFRENYEAEELKEFLKRDASNPKQNLSFAENYLKGSVAQAMDYFQRSRDAADEVRAHERYGNHPDVVALLDAYEEAAAAWKAKVDEQLLVADMKKETQRAMDNLSHARNYFDSGHEGQAMDYYGRAKECAESIGENEQFAGRPEITDFFAKFNAGAEAFSTYYKEKVLGKKVKDATQMALQVLDQSFNYLKGNEGQALDHYSRAKDRCTEIAETTEFRGIPEVEDFFVKFDARAKEFVAAYDAQKLKEDVRTAKSRAATPVSHAESYFASGHHGRALEYIEEAKAELETIEADTRLMAVSEVADTIPAVRERIVAFETMFREKVLADELRKLTDTAMNQLRSSESYFKGNHDRGMEILADAKSRALDVATDSRFDDMPAAQEFLAKFEAEAAERSAQFNATLLAEDLKKAKDCCTMPLNIAKSKMGKYPEGQVVSEFEKAADALDAFENNGYLLGSSLAGEATAFLEKFRSDLADAKAEFAATCLGKELKKALDRPRTLLSHANSYFESGHHAQCLGYLDDARSAAGDLAVDSTFNELPEVAQFFVEFDSGVAAFKAKYDAWQKDQAVRKAQALVTDNFRNAKSYFDSHRRGQALDYLRKARDALNDFGYNLAQDLEGGAEWMEAREKEILEFEDAYTAAVFQDDLKKVKAACRDPLGRVQGAVDRKDLNQAMRDLNAATEAAENLGQDDRFLRSAEVDSFLESFHTDAAALRATIDAYIEGERRKKRRDRADQLLSHARSYFTNHQRGRAFEYLYQARDAIEEIEYDADETDKDFIAKWKSSAEAFEQECNKAIFEEEVKSLLRMPHDYLSQAEFQFSTGAHGRSVELLAKANEAAEALAEPKYMDIPEVAQWFKEWVPKVKAVQSAWDAKILADEERKARQAIEQRMSNAQICFRQQSNDRAIEELKQCRDALAGLQDGDIWRLDSVRSFHSDFQTKIQTFEKEFNASVFDNEAKQRVAKCERDLAQASTMLQRHAYSSALEAFQTAREEVSILRNDTRFAEHPAVVKFLAGAEATMAEFSSSYAKSQLEDQAKSLVSAIRIGLAGADAMTKRNAMGAALTHLTEARSSAADFEKEAMFLTLPAVVSALNDLKAAETQFAEKQLKSEADSIVKAAQKHLVQADKYEAIGCRKKAQAELREARAAAIDSYENRLYHTLPAVTQLHESVKEKAKALDVSFETTSTRGVGGGSTPTGDGPTVSSVIGGIIACPNLRLKSFTLSTDVSPKVFTEIKNLNDIGGRINRAVRGAFRHAEGLPIDDNKQPFRAVNPEATYATLENDINNLEKMVVRPLSKEGIAEIPLAKEALESIAAFNKGWNECKERWAHAADLLKSMRQIDAIFEWADKVLEHFDDCMSSSNSSVGSFNVMTAASSFSGGGAGVPHKLEAHTACLEVMKALDDIERRGKRIEEKFGGWPGRPAVEAAITAMRKKCIHDHPRHVVRRMLNCASNMVGGRSAYWQALRRFPKAREAAMKLWELKCENMFLRRHHDRRDFDDKEWVLEDPFKGQEIADAFEETAQVDLREGYEWITPADPSLAVRPAKSMKDSKLWSDVHKKYAGKIVFSKAPIDPTESKDSSFTTAFSGSDNIFGRAYWPHAISQLPLAKNKETGEPEYGPRFMLNRNCWQHWLELLQVVTIDGQEIKRDDQPHGTFSFFKTRGARNVKDEKQYESKLGTQVDFYAFTQSMRLHVSRPAVDDTDDDWECASNRILFHLSQLPAGKHTVKIDLCFRYCSGNDNYPAKLEPAFPMRSTELSHPIASGEFEIDTAKNPVKMGAMFPKRKTGVGSVAASYEKQIKELLCSSSGWGRRSPKTEVPIYVALEGDWYCSGTKWYRSGDCLVEEPTEYSIPFVAFFYRSPQHGWNREEIAVFHLSAVTQSGRGQKPSPPFVGIAVGNSHTFDVDLLNPAELSTFTRSPPELRAGVF